MALKVPQWSIERPHITKSYLYPPFKHQEKTRPRPFKSIPQDQQEQVICEDVLNALLGYEGVYISTTTKSNSAEIAFDVDPGVDKPLADLVDRHLPLCKHHVFISQYVAKYSRYEWGLVAQAFAAAVDAVMKEYMILIGKLEDQVRRQEGFSLQKLYYHLQPAAHNMSTMYNICRQADALNCVGGGLLQQLYQTFTELAGDTQARALIQFLLEKATAPYFEMLEMWLYQGCINDPRGEFLIEEQPHYKKEQLSWGHMDKYWEQRYILRSEMFPAFLHPYSNRILMTGKYLNVIRECGRDVISPYKDKITYMEHHREYGAKIDQAYGFACAKLLELIMDEENLLLRLSSLKHYFFLDQGDFFVDFINNAEEELRKSTDEINLNKLDSVLEHAVRAGTTSQDMFHADVTCELQTSTLPTSLRRINKQGEGPASGLAQQPVQGLDSFALHYKVSWPVSLIISPQAVAKYQLLFRHLFKCKWVERLLCHTWISTQPTRMSDDRTLFSRCFSLRQRMLQFIQNFQYYMMFEVVEPNWQEMVNKCKAAVNVDEIMVQHTKFLDCCLVSCMLTNTRLFKILSEIMTSCTIFAEWFPETVSSRFGTRDRASVASLVAETLQETVAQFERNFDQRLKELLQQLNGIRAQDKMGSVDVQLKHLIQRLDFNGYYLQHQFYTDDTMMQLGN